MASPKNLFLLSGGYNTNTSNWLKSRPNGFVPFHSDNTTYMIDNMETKQRDGSSWYWTETLGDSHTYRSNADGIWYNGNYDSSRVYRHRVDHKVEHYSYILCGYNPNTTSFTTVEKGNSAPVTNFTGIQFKWNTAGSHWSDSAIRINSNTAVSLICYNWQSGKIFTQNSVNMYYSGRSPITDGSNANVSNNGCAFILSDEDVLWIRENRIYLVGFMIQFYQKSEGGASRDRYFNIWDTQVVYSGLGVGDSSKKYRMVMPDKQDNGIGYHGEPVTRRPIKLYHS